MMRSATFIVLTLLSSALMTTDADAELASRSPASADEVENEDFNFNWLDPDKKVYVLQNRKFRKKGRVLLTGMVGFDVSEPFRTTFNFDPRIAYYFSENWGIEGFFTAFSNSANGTFNALKTASPNALPQIREFRSQIGALLHWSPWYAKINVFNTILYFDWYFSAGLGQVNAAVDTNTVASNASNFVDESLFAFYAGTGHQYYLSQSFIVRLDFMGAIYNAPVFGVTGDKSWLTNFKFDFGVGFRL